MTGKPGEPTIWLIEAKDPASVHAIGEAARQLRTFFRDSTSSEGKTKRSCGTLLARKKAELKPYTDRVATKLGLEPLPAGSSYVLPTLFVTRNTSPAGYVGQRYPVLTTTGFVGPWRQD